MVLSASNIDAQYGGTPARPTPSLLRGDYYLGAGAANATFTGEGGRAGRSMACAGDVNGDGYDDFLVGAYQNDAGGNDAGRVYLFYGNGTANLLSGDYNLGAGAANATFTGAAAGDNAGRAVAGAGDVNGDGYDDILIGAPLRDMAMSNTGQAYLIYGNGSTNPLRGDYNLVNAANATFYTNMFGDNTGASVAGAGDVNDDGYDDILIGAPYVNSGMGRAYLLYGGGACKLLGNTQILSNANWTLDGAVDYNVGQAVAGAGDVNSDGYDDFLVGVPYYGAGGSYAGRAYLIYGNGSATTVSGNYNLTVPSNGRFATFTGAAAGDNAGFSVSDAGDVNGDGHDDLLIGAPGNAAGGSLAGRVYLFYGNSTSNILRGDYNLTGTANATFTGAAAGDYAWRVAGAGDVNSDGYDDILVGAALNDAGASNNGRAYLFYGNGAANPLRGDYNLGTGAANATFAGAAADDHAGVSVAGVGDVNGDGFADFLVGAENNDAGGGDAGRAYLFYGNYTSIYPARVTDLAASLATPNSVTLTWTAPGDNDWSGTAQSYLLRVSCVPITGDTWASATPVTAPAPVAPRTMQSFNVTGLTPGGTCPIKYYFAIVAVDGDGHQGSVSNSPSAIVPVLPPGAPAITTPPDVAYSVGDGLSHHIEWNATDATTSSPFYTVRVNGGAPSSPVAWVTGNAFTYDVGGWLAGTYYVEVTVADGYGLSATDIVIVTVTAPLDWWLVLAFVELPVVAIALALAFTWRKKAIDLKKANRDPPSQK